MSKNIYLDINSHYRDRNSWPNPANFEIPFSTQTKNNNKSASDPVSEHVAEKIWIADNFETNDGNSTSIALTVDQSNGIGKTADQLTVIVTGTRGQLQRSKEYYTAAQVVTSTATDLNRIISYKYIGGETSSEKAQLTFANKFISPLANGNTITIHDPTNLATKITPVFFVPGGSLGSNSYPGYFLFNEKTQTYRLITSYDNITKLLTIDTSKSSTELIFDGPVTSWVATNTIGLTFPSGDIYSIRKKIPKQYTLTAANSHGASVGCPETKRSFNLSTTDGTKFITNELNGSFLERCFQKLSGPSSSHSVSTNDELKIASQTYSKNSLQGCTIRMIDASAPGGEIRTIKSSEISGSDTLIIVSPAFSASPASKEFLITCPNESKRIIKYVNFSGTLPTGGTFSTTEIDFPSTASNVNNYYNDLYIVVTETSSDNTNTRLIKNYTVIKDINDTIISRKATIYTTSGGVAFDLDGSGQAPIAGDTFTITSGITESFTASLEYDEGSRVYNNKVYLLPFKEDNFNSLKPIQSSIINTRLSLYEIDLINLTLPNKILQSHYGDYITQYPYLTVGIENVNGNKGGTNIISNNPSSQRVYFKAAIVDTSHTSTSSFIKIDGNHMSQTIRFNPYNPLKFFILLPNGEDLIFTSIDNFSPYYPDPLLQISALFCLRSLENKKLPNPCDL